jgi:hypothetical protein
MPCFLTGIQKMISAARLKLPHCWHPAVRLPLPPATFTAALTLFPADGELELHPLERSTAGAAMAGAWPAAACSTPKSTPRSIVASSTGKKSLRKKCVRYLIESFFTLCVAAIVLGVSLLFSFVQCDLAPRKSID